MRHMSGVLALSCCFTYGQQASQHGSPDMAETIVERVVQSTLRRGESSVSGYKTSTWVPIASADRARVMELKEDAIGPLSLRLGSPVPFVQLIAVQLLGSIGGSRCVGPLASALSAERWVVIRMQALYFLESTPDSEAIPLIEARLRDSDKRVSERAEEILLEHYGLSPEAITLLK